MVADVVPGLRKPAAQWTLENPVLSSTQLGQETDTLLVKRGNDIDPWNLRPYDNTIIIDADGNIVATPRMRSAAQSIMLDLVPPLPPVVAFVPPAVPTPYPGAALYPAENLYPNP